MMDGILWLVMPAAFALDLLIGDPPAWPHPIRWMGKSIEIYEPVVRRWLKHEMLAGAVFAVSLIAAWWGMTAAMLHAVRWFHPVAGFVLEVVLIFFCLSVRSLYDAGMEIYHLLLEGRVNAARTALAMIVGRDVHHYDGEQIARATVETVAENFVDGVLSPLFYAAIGGAPLAVAYKMVNTLDSMVGYKNDRYLRFGRVAARIDDVANYIPARLSVPVIAMATGLLAPGRGKQALMTAVAEGSSHSSPNAGYSEAAFAGALSVKLNGPNFYGGVLVEKPFIGKGYGRVDTHDIQMGCQLMVLSAIISAAIAWLVSMGYGLL
ncbi:MAG: adenosylcobinamide-phosphate synthase CbiB [Desulfobacteraceae bacterium]